MPFGSIYILRGRQKFTIEGEEFDLGPGDVIHVPASVVHSTIIEEEVEAIYVKDTSWGLKGVPAGENAPDTQPLLNTDQRYCSAGLI